MVPEENKLLNSTGIKAVLSDNYSLQLLANGLHPKLCLAAPGAEATLDARDEATTHLSLFVSDDDIRVEKEPLFEEPIQFLGFDGPRIASD